MLSVGSIGFTQVERPLGYRKRWLRVQGSCVSAFVREEGFPLVGVKRIGLSDE